VHSPRSPPDHNVCAPHSLQPCCPFYGYSTRKQHRPTHILGADTDRISHNLLQPPPSPFRPKACLRPTPLVAPEPQRDRTCTKDLSSRTQPVPSAWDVSPTSSTSVRASPCGMAPKPTAGGPLMGALLQKRVSPSAQTGSTPRAANPPVTSGTSALAVGAQIMEFRTALERRKLKSLTPYNPDTWEALLRSSGLIARYPYIPKSLYWIHC